MTGADSRFDRRTVLAGLGTAATPTATATPDATISDGPGEDGVEGE